MENTLLNLVPASYLPEVHLSQYDVGRELKFTLKDGSSDYSVPSGAVVTVKATKPSGLGFVVNATADGNVVTLSNTATMTNENGRFPAELSIVQGQNVIGTSNFIFNIERSPHPEGTIDGDAESLLPELTLLVERIEAAADSVDEDTQTVTEAKAEVLQAKADTLQAKADTLAARDDALQAKADAITAKESAEASAQAAAEASERAEQLIGSVSTKADAIVKTASGEIASFTDGGDDLPMKSLKVNIVPKQSGSGDPSPSNVRPISGYSEVVTSVAGKNLCPSGQPNEMIEVNLLKGWGVFASAKESTRIRLYDKNQNEIDFWAIQAPYENGTRYYRNFFVVGDTRYVKFEGSSEYQIEFAVQNPTPYTPYQGDTYPISLGQTVYGGTLDVVSGKLTLTWASRLVNSMSWTYVAPSSSWAKGLFYTSDVNSVKKAGIENIKCERYKTLRNNTDDYLIFGNAPNGYVYIVDSTYSSASAMVSAIGTMPIIYELATPIEVALTPTQVTTLLGNNNIWADSGTVEVEYRADTTLVYNELLSLIASLS